MNEKKNPIYHMISKNSNSDGKNPNRSLEWKKDVNEKEREKIIPKNIIFR